MKTTAAEQLARLPGPVTQRWPEGEASIVALAHGSMTCKLFAPRGADRQVPHDQDELYFVISGHGAFERAGVREAFGPGTALFVSAGIEHRFAEFTPDFATWVVFWGPPGGET